MVRVQKWEKTSGRRFSAIRKAYGGVKSSDSHTAISVCIILMFLCACMLITFTQFSEKGLAVRLLLEFPATMFS